MATRVGLLAGSAYHYWNGLRYRQTTMIVIVI